MGKFSLIDTILGCFKSKIKSDPDDALETVSKNAKQCSPTVVYQPHKDDAIIVIFNEGFTLTPGKTSHQFVEIQELDYAVTSSVADRYTPSSSEPSEQEKIVTNAEAVNRASVHKSLKEKPPDSWFKKERKVHDNEVDDSDYHGTSEGFSSVASQLPERKTKKRPEKAKKVKNSKFFMCQKFKMAETIQYLSEEEEVQKPEVDNCYYCGSSEVFSSLNTPKTEIETKNKIVNKSKKILKFPKFKKAKKYKSLVEEEEKMSSSETANETEPSIGEDKPSKPWEEFRTAVKKENVVKKHRVTSENKVENVVDDTMSALRKKKKSFKKKVVKIVTLSKVRKAIRGKTSKT